MEDATLNSKWKKDMVTMNIELKEPITTLNVKLKTNNDSEFQTEDVALNSKNEEI